MKAYVLELQQFSLKEEFCYWPLKKIFFQPLIAFITHIGCSAPWCSHSGQSIFHCNKSNQLRLSQEKKKNGSREGLLKILRIGGSSNRLALSFNAIAFESLTLALLAVPINKLLNLSVLSVASFVTRDY